jgi:hypothetical protein
LSHFAGKFCCIFKFPSDLKFFPAINSSRKKGEGSMNAASADEDGAGLKNLPPNGASEGRVTGAGRHPARAEGAVSAGLWADSRSDWVVWAEALSGR